MTAWLYWPEWVRSSASWPACRELISRCQELAARHKLPATLMLVGSPGLGREAVAIELAAGLVSHGGLSSGCVCSSCQRVRRGIHPDVEVVWPGQDKSDGTDITIGQARELAHAINLRPYEGKCRVFIFSSCETPPLNTDAASSLLKTLEEPPPHVTFLLLAANPEKVLPTVLSRSVQVRVPPPTQTEAVALLASACATDHQHAAAVLTACLQDPALVLPRDVLQLAVDDCGATAFRPQYVAALVEASQYLESVLPAVLAGDVAAASAVATVLEATPGAFQLAVAHLLKFATVVPPEEAERALDAAAALLVEERRHALLRLPMESAVLAALVPFATGAR